MINREKQWPGFPDERLPVSGHFTDTGNTRGRNYDPGSKSLHGHLIPFWIACVTLDMECTR